MSGSYVDPNWTAKVTIPVKRVGEHWEFFYGGVVPVGATTAGVPLIARIFRSVMLV